MTTIIVPLDGTDFGARALDVAYPLARRRQDHLHLVGVSPDRSITEDDLTSLALRFMDVGVQVTLEVIEAKDGEDAAELIGRVVRGHPDGLLCMASKGRSTGAALIGSTTEAVLARLGRPVLVVGPRCEHGWDRKHQLTIPLDGSDWAERVLPIAARLARSWHLNPCLVEVAHPLDRFVADRARDALARPRAEMARHGLDPHAQLLWASDTARCITSEARSQHASIIVMATHLRTGASRLILGSTTMGVIHSAPCPVLVCPPQVLAGGADDPATLCITGR